MTTLWDTTGTAVVKALAAERRTGGAVTSGNALTLVVVVDEPMVPEAEAAATTAASMHPCRLLIVVRREIEAPRPRLDAEVLVGGRLGPGEAVVMRMFGRLALHAESVTLPLLAPDAPVVTWWHGPPPERIETDPLGVVADRRITDCIRAGDPIAGLHQRANDYVPGDTDLGWTRTTPWRGALAAAFDSVDARPTAAAVRATARSTSGLLFTGWLRSRLGLDVQLQTTSEPAGQVGILSARVDLDGGGYVELARSGSTVEIRYPGRPEQKAALFERDLGELLGEELRRLDADQPYADALGAATGLTGLSERPMIRTHVWLDPALQDEDQPAPAAQS